MLSPDDLEKAGELVGSVYTQVEAEMLDYLTAKMIEGDVAGQRSQTAILLLAQSSTADLRGILDEHGAAIDEAVRKEVAGALKRSDADDLAKIKRGLGVELPALTNRQTVATTAGIQAILQRHNLQMEQAAKDAFIRCSTEAVTMVNTGAMTTEQALHRAVRKLEREGVTIIQYQDEATGRKTVANKLDVAVRRHVRTQIAQDGARLTELRMDEAGIEYVEVSSHAGARPSHQEWEGQVYSRNGRKTVGGVTYEDFRTACHWGDVADGIYGANCRHSHGPWIPGTPRSYEKDPEHPSGLDNDEVYALNQKQREMERGIRATKRELRGCEIEYEKTGSLEAQAEAARLKKKLQDKQAKLRDFIDEANGKGKAPVLQRSARREWAGDMPRTKVPAVSGRKIDDVLGMPSVAKRIEGAGTSKTAVRKQLASELADDGLTARSFQYLTADQQGNFIARALNSLKAALGKVDGTAKAAGGAHAASAQNIAAKITGKGLDDAHVRGIANVAENAADPKTLRVFTEAAEDLIIDDSAAAGSYYSPSTKGITFNAANTAAGFAYRSDKAPYQTFFHEFGHLFDHRTTGYGVVTVRQGRRQFLTGETASYAAGLHRVARRDVNNWINGMEARHRAAVMNDPQFAGAGYQFIIDHEVERRIKDELDQLFDQLKQDHTLGGLADVVHGSTRGKYGYGHPQRGYWTGERGNRSLATETFAHFFECEMANPEALEVLKQYLPNAYNTYRSIIEGAIT